MELPACLALPQGREPPDSLEQLGLEQPLQAVTHHRLPEQDLFPGLPCGETRTQKGVTQGHTPLATPPSPPHPASGKEVNKLEEATRDSPPAHSPEQGRGGRAWSEPGGGLVCPSQHDP